MELRLETKRESRPNPEKDMIDSPKEINWDVKPNNGMDVFFCRDLYDKYSMSPNLLELFLMANRPSGKIEKASVKDAQVSGQPSSSAPEEEEEELQPMSTIVPLPEPAIPYPFFSCLTSAEQKVYVHLLAKYSSRCFKSIPHGPQKQEYTQYLNFKAVLQNEISEFLKFMQNVARKCAADYEYITKDALRYTEEFLRASLEQVKKYPEAYILHEITSIMGGKVCTYLTFKLEKKVLALGKTPFVKACFPVMPSVFPVPVDYKTVSTSVPPEKRAASEHQDISSDPNAEKLAFTYRPQVVLTAQSLFTLMNNHGINYKEQWEIPVCVKMLQIEGAQPLKLVFIDPPLPKKELNVREKNQLFHEVPFDFWMSKKTYVHTALMMLDLLEKEFIPHGDGSHEVAGPPRPVLPESVELDFEEDVTELETFGVTCKPLKTFKTPSSPVKPKPLPAALLSKLQLEKKLLSSGEANAEAKPIKGPLQRLEPGASSLPDQSTRARLMPAYESLFSDSDDTQSFKGFASDEIEEFVESDSDANTSDVLESGSDVPPKRTCSRVETSTSDTRTAEEVARSTSCTSDTDEERLVIDTGCQGSENWFEATVSSAAGTMSNPPRAPFPRPTSSDNSTKAGKRKRATSKPAKRLSKDFDPVGQILKMQTQLMKITPRKTAEQPLGSPDIGSLVRPMEKPALAPVFSPPSGNAANATTATRCFQTETYLLPVELQMLAEDTSEYTTPEHGNMVYKLFSLDGMLLLIRSSVQKARTKSRNLKKGLTQHIATFVLPKVEYQASYGVEALTESEICRLWTESLLHSYCSFYIGHVDAFSSALFMLEEITADGIKEKFGTFKPSNSLNILRHILKKVISLQEGSYLLTHAAGDSSVSIYKSINNKVSRTAYNLHKAHSSMPRVPNTLSVPWVPLDPTILLPFHVAQGRVPCTFPPRLEGITERKRCFKVGVSENQRQMPNSEKIVSMETQSSGSSATGAKGGSPKKNKKNKGKRLKRYIKWMDQKKQRK